MKKRVISALLAIVMFFSMGCFVAPASAANAENTYISVFASPKGKGFSVWQSQSSQKKTFNVGDFIYIWGLLHNGNKKLYKSYASGKCNLTVSIYKPNGSCAYTYTYKNCDNNWIGHKLDVAGKWKIESKVSGALNGTAWSTITVKDNRNTYNDVFASPKGKGYSLSQARASESRTFNVDDYVYVWGYFHDVNNNLYKSYGSGTCNMTLSIYKPNGTCAFTYTYNNSDNNWIGCKLNVAGTWKIESKITGSLSGTNTQTITVKKNTGSSLSISGQSIPTSINQGSGFTCKGTITSNYNITKVVVRIVNSNGGVVSSATRYPNSKSYNIINLDSDVHFSYAKAGTNRYQIYATDAKGEKCLVNTAFEVKNDTVTSTVYGSPQIGKYNGKQFYVFSQRDKKWANEPYLKGTINGKYQDATVGTSACHLLSLVNATHWLSGKFIDPVWLARYAIDKGYRKNGSIDMAGLYKDISNNYGLTYGIKYAGYTSGEKRFTNLKKHLQDGEVAIGGGMGHVMAVVAYDSTTEKYLVLDSYGTTSRKTNNCWYIWKSSSQMTGKFGFSYFYFISKQK